MQDAVHTFFERSSDALLLCQREESTAEYHVKAINLAARALLGSNGSLTTPAPIAQILPSQALLRSVEAAYSTGNQQIGVLKESSISGTTSALSYVVELLDNVVLIQLSEADRQLTQGIGQHIQVTELTCVAVFQAIRNEAGTIENLRMTFLNEAARKAPFLGIPAQIGDLITDWYPNTRSLGQFNQYVEVIESGNPFVSEKYYPDKDYNYHIAASKHGDGIIISFYNHTDTLLAERNAQNQYELLESILDSSENVIFVAEAVRAESGNITDFKIARGNKNAMAAFKQTFGIDVEGLSITHLLGRKPDLFDEAIRIMETGEPLIMEQRYEPNSDKWFKVSIHKLNNGLVLTYVDVTPIQTALLEAKQQAELVQAILDSSINGLYAMEPVKNDEGVIVDFKILMVNQAGLRLSTYSLDEIIGNTYLTLFPVVNEVGLFEKYQKAVMEGIPYRTEIGFPVARQPNIRWFDLSLSQIGNGMIILTFMDITERVLLSQKQEELLEKLRKSNQDLERFAYIASHDLSEPTRKIVAFGEMLVKQHASSLPKGGLDLVNRMQSASVRMQELVDGILTYSRFSNQTQEHLTVPLMPIIKNVLSDLQTTLEEKKAMVKMSELPSIKGNPIYLGQLFQNLISNSLKFIDGHTVPLIRIDVGPATPGEIRETVLDSSKAWLAIRVRDNGIGFDSSQRNRVFELFARLHGRSHYPGSGLGLAICKRIAELHGGGITVESTPGEGTVFSVVLPALE